MTTFAGLTGPLPHGQLAEHAHQRLDDLEAAILEHLEPIHMPVTHRFMPGLYSREIFMPAGAVLTSQVHETEHPFVVLTGRVRVAVPGAEAILLEAGQVGVTLPGTRRALFVEQDCRWITFHPLSAEEEEARQNGATIDELLEAIRFRILGKRERPDGRDTSAEHKARLARCGLPQPDDGAARELSEGATG